MTSKKLGFWSIVLLAINSIVGSGIFLTPGVVITMVGKLGPLAYIAAALLAACLAVTFAVAAKYVTKSGSAYAYAKAAFGSRFGFYMGTVRYFSAAVAWGVMAVSVIKSTLSIFGGDTNNFWLVTACFIILMAIITLINFGGEPLFAFINNLATIGKVAALALLIIAGTVLVIKTGHSNAATLAHLTDGHNHALIPPVTTSTFVMAVATAFYAFTGFESVASGSADMEAPEKNLPRAIPLAIILIALVYIGTITVAIMVNPQAIVTTKQVVALAAIFTNPWLRNLILTGALISMFGINIAASFNTPRILEAMATEGQVPQWLAHRNHRDFPARAYLITVILALIIPMAFNYSVPAIILLSAMVRFFEFAVIPLAVIMFYYGKAQEPLLPAPRNWWTDVVIPALGMVVTILLLIKYDWVGEFTLNGAINWYAIGGMIVGFILLPLAFAWFAQHDHLSQA